MPNTKLNETLLDCGVIRPRRRNIFAALLRETNLKCLILTLLITISLTASFVWCNRTTRITTVNFSAFPIAITRQVSPCDEGYSVYIPSAFILMLYFLYIVECYYSKAREMLSLPKIDVNTVYRKVDEMRRARPLIWWRATCYHYTRRTNQFTRFRNGDAYTTSKVCYERVNSHVATSCFYYGGCGMKDISRDLVDLEKYPVTKVQFNKGFIFSNTLTAQEFQDQRALFFQDEEENDDYMEMKEGLDLSNVTFVENMTSWADPENLPYYGQSRVFWLCSFLLLSWPLRVILELNTAHVHYRVTKIFGTNYATPQHQSPANNNNTNTVPVSISMPGTGIGSGIGIGFDQDSIAMSNNNINSGSRENLLNAPIRPPHAWWRRRSGRAFWMPAWRKLTRTRSRSRSRRRTRTRSRDTLNLITEGVEESDSDSGSNSDRDLNVDPDQNCALVSENINMNMIDSQHSEYEKKWPDSTLDFTKNPNQVTQWNWWPWNYFNPHAMTMSYRYPYEDWYSVSHQVIPRSVTLLMCAPKPIDIDNPSENETNRVGSVNPNWNSTLNLGNSDTSVPTYSQALLWMNHGSGNRENDSDSRSHLSNGEGVDFHGNGPDESRQNERNGNANGTQTITIGRSNSDNYGLSRNLSNTANTNTNTNVNATSSPFSPSSSSCAFHPHLHPHGENSSFSFSSSLGPVPKPNPTLDPLDQTQNSNESSTVPSSTFTRSLSLSVSRSRSWSNQIPTSLNPLINPPYPHTNSSNEPTPPIPNTNTDNHSNHPLTFSTETAAFASSSSGDGERERERQRGGVAIVRSDSSRVLNAVIPRATGVQIDLTNPVSASVPFDRYSETRTRTRSRSSSTSNDHNNGMTQENSNDDEEPPNYMEALRTSRPVFIPPWTRLRRCFTEKDVFSSSRSGLFPQSKRGLGMRQRPLWLQDIRPTFLLSARPPVKNSSSSSNISFSSNTSNENQSNSFSNPNPNQRSQNEP